MAWTTPKTDFASGNILTAAQMNAIGNDLLALININSTSKTDTFSVSLSANSFSSNVTGLEVTITPTTNTSKILVVATVAATAESGVTVGGWRIMRGASAVSAAVGATAGSRNSLSAFNASTYDQGAGGNAVTVAALDSPATTSAVTYGVQLRNLSGLTRTHYVNRGFTDTDSNNFNRLVSTITAIEVPV
jgi:hypothetical protein